MHAFLKPTVVLLLGIVASFIVYVVLTKTHEAEAIERVRTVAQGIDPKEIEALSGTLADLETPGYESLKAYLMSIRASDPQLRFVYVLGKNAEGQLFFYADSEEDGTRDASPPGQVYYEATEPMKNVIEDGVPRTEGPDRDRWGVWMSAHAPLGNPPIALVGMDIPASDYFARALLLSLVPFFASVGLLMFLLLRHAALK